MKPLYISYLNGAGGKALINCLHCSHDTVFNDIDIHNKQLSYSAGNLSESSLDALILSRLLSTIPSVNSDKWWSNYEIHNLIKGCDNPNISSASNCQVDVPESVRHTNNWLPLVTHYYKNWQCYNRLLGAGFTVKLEPYIPFIDTAIRIKWVKPDNGAEPCLDLNQLHAWKKDTEAIVTDLTIVDYDPLADSFFDHVNLVSSKLNIIVRWHIADVYISAYRKYHWDMIKQLGLTSY